MDLCIPVRASDYDPEIFIQVPEYWVALSVSDDVVRRAPGRDYETRDRYGLLINIILKRYVTDNNSIVEEFVQEWTLPERYCSHCCKQWFVS